MLKINLYKNKNQESRQFGKVYGRVENNEPIDIEGLSEHIAMHGSQYTKDVIYGVLIKAAACIKELALSGQPVKLGNLAIFKAAVTSKPAATADKFDLATNISAVRLQVRGTGATATKEMAKGAQLQLTDMAQRIVRGEIELSNEKGKYIERTTNP